MGGHYKNESYFTVG